MRAKMNLQGERGSQVVIPESDSRATQAQAQQREEVATQLETAEAMKKQKKSSSSNPLKSFKRFFSSRKGKTKKADEKALKTESLGVLEAPNEADEDKEGQLAGRSMSEDSVFSGKVQQTPTAGDLTRSMDVLPQRALQEELARRMRQRGDDDEGPPSPTTVLIENGLQEKSMSQDSDHSLMSMDSSEAELEEMFFKDKWSSKRAQSPDPGADFDLDFVASSSSLNMTAAKHKIAIKPKTKKRSTPHSGQRRKATSPKTTGGVMVLPLLKEESQAAPPSEDDHDDVAHTSHERVDTTDDEVERLEEDVALENVEPEVKVEEPTPDAPVEAAADVEVAAEESPLKDILRPKPSRGEDRGEAEGEAEAEATEARPGSGVEVVLRRGEAAGRDPGKRQTFSGSPAVLRVAASSPDTKRSSVHGEPSVSGGEGGGGASGKEGANEFSHAFSKFKQQAKNKRLQQEQKASGQVTASLAASTAAAGSATTAEKAKDINSNSESKIKSVASKKDSSHRKSDPKIKSVVIAQSDAEDKSEARQSEAPSAAKSLGAKKEMVVIKKSSTNEPLGQSAAQDSAHKNVTSSQNAVKKTIVIKTASKEATEKANADVTQTKRGSTEAPKGSRNSGGRVSGSEAAPPGGDPVKTEEAPYKLNSPRNKNRARSKTLPGQSTESAISVAPSAGDSSSARRRALSQGTDKDEKTETGAPDTKAPSGLIRSAVPAKAPPGKVKVAAAGGAGGQPSWIQLARLKTQDWSQDTDSVETSKTPETTSNDAVTETPTLTSPVSSVKGMVKNWGKP